MYTDKDLITKGKYIKCETEEEILQLMEYALKIGIKNTMYKSMVKNPSSYISSGINLNEGKYLSYSIQNYLDNPENIIPWCYFAPSVEKRKTLIKGYV